MEIIVSESAGRKGDKTPDALQSAAASYAWFEPATMQLLESIVEEAWQELVKSGSPLAGQGQEHLTRELIAHRVMARAARGERDRERLKEHALWGFLP